MRRICGGRMAIMEEKITSLYERINRIGFQSMHYKDGRYLERARKLLPEVEGFASWFLGGDGFGLDRGTYGALCQNLLGILQDCMEALGQEDRVLMMDALEQGVSGYLEMFLPGHYFEDRETAYVKRDEG